MLVLRRLSQPSSEVSKGPNSFWRAKINSALLAIAQLPPTRVGRLSGESFLVELNLTIIREISDRFLKDGSLWL